jgi:hypothetical protein
VSLFSFGTHSNPGALVVDVFLRFNMNYKQFITASTTSQKNPRSKEATVHNAYSIWKIQQPNIELEYYKQVTDTVYVNDVEKRKKSDTRQRRSLFSHNKRVLKSIVSNNSIVQNGNGDHNCYYSTIDTTTPQQANKTINKELSRFSFVAGDPLSCSFFRKFTQRTFCDENLNFFIAVTLFQSRYEAIIKQEEMLKQRKRKKGEYHLGSRILNQSKIQPQQRNSNISETSSVTSSCSTNEFIDIILSPKKFKSLDDMVYMIWNRFCDENSVVSIP